MGSWWEAAPVVATATRSPGFADVSSGASTTSGSAPWWEAAPLAAPEAPAPRPVTMADLNVGMGPGGIPASVDPRPGAKMAAGGVAMIAAAPIAGPAFSLATSPAGAAALGGGLEYARSGSVVRAGKAALEDGLLATGAGAVGGVVSRFLPGASRGLTAMIAHGLGRAAAESPAAAAAIVKAAAPVAEAAAEAAPAVAGKFAPGWSHPAIRAARAAATAGAEVAPEAAAADGELAAQLQRSLTPEAKAAYAEARTAREAAAAAPRGPGLPTVADSAGAAASSAVKAPTQKQLVKAGVEVEKKILSLLGGTGLSKPQMAAALREMYGIPPSKGIRMIEMVQEAHAIH